MITHIPTDSCIHTWGYRYQALADRYQNVIRMSLFGHTHSESFKVTRAMKDRKSIGFNYVCGGVTTYQERNPSFSVIEVDAEYFVPLDIQTYYMDLDKANKEKNPTWELMHTFTDDYEIPDLSPASLLTLAEKIRDSEDVAAEYLWNKDKRHGGKGSCDAGCRKSNFCDVTSIETKEIEHIHSLDYWRVKAFQPGAQMF